MHDTQTPNPLYDDSEYQYAGFWLRFLAMLIDTILMFVITAPWTVYQFMQMSQLPADQIPTYSVVDIVINVLWVVAVIWFWVKKGATPGKMVFGLQLRDAKTGRLVGVGQALLRYLIGYTVSALVLGLGFLWAGFDKKKQGWHDKIASTVVVKRIR